MSFLAFLPGQSFEERVAEIKPRSAKDWYDLALWAKIQNINREFKPSLHKALEVDPRFEPALRMLGYQNVDGQWLTGDELKTAKGMVLHNGRWITSEDKQRIDGGMFEYRGKWYSEEEYYYKRGYVQYLGKWVSKARAKRMEARQKRYREIAKMRSDWDTAWKFDTAYFRITTNVSAQVAYEMGQAMDMCYAQLMKVFGARWGKAKVPLEVYATQQQFMEGSARAGMPVSPGVLGYFYWGRGMGIRCYYAGSLEMTLATLFHECTHLVARKAIGGEIPTWSNEGMAVFMEDAQRGEKELNLQTVPWGRLWHLKRQLRTRPDSVSLNRLVEIQGAGAYSVEYYPQGWAFIYFMMFYDDGKYRKNFVNYYNGLIKQRGTRKNREFFKLAFEKDPKEFRKEWEDFVMNLEPDTAKEYAGAAMTCVSDGSWFDAGRAQAYAEKAVEMDARDWRLRLVKARVLLRSAMMEPNPDQASILYARSAENFKEAFEMGRVTELKVKRGQSILPKTLMHCDYARANIGAGNYDEAAETLEMVLEVDELSSTAYRTLALLLGTATSENHRNIEEALHLMDIADDLGAHHENLYVRAMIAVQQGQNSQAQSLLQQAISQDRFGFGQRYYSYWLARL